MRAIWKDTVLAQSDATVVVDGNHYFPPDAVQQRFLRPSQSHTTCPWKGIASYYDVVVAGGVNPDAAWFYVNPKPAASAIQGYVAFWHGVDVVD